MLLSLLLLVVVEVLLFVVVEVVVVVVVVVVAVHLLFTQNTHEELRTKIEEHTARSALMQSAIVEATEKAQAIESHAK